MERAKGNLPVEYTSFIGRGAEVGEGLRALSSTRLLTITGPGGTGKTRVATRIAARARRRFPGGIWYAELSAVTDERALIEHVAAAIGRPGPGTPEGIASALRERRALLVLDTCEHLVGPVSRLVEVILRWTGHVKVLATGRQALDVRGQRLVDVRPLPEPDAVALFADRAAAVDPEFELTGEVRDAVTAICRRLDGLPLAIELAAAGLRSLSAPELSDMLDSRSPMPAARTTNALARQRDLRSLVYWSYALCGAEQRAFWAALSVVGGPFGVEVAEAIGVDVGLPRVRVAAVLGDLVDSSIVLRDGLAYRLLGPFRQVGIELLEAPARERLVARYGAARPAEPPGQAREREAGDLPLTRREVEVALLIAEGLTNAEIAHRLVISKRTVDAHVRNILAKGSLASRAQVAAWVTDRHSSRCEKGIT